MKSSKLNNKLVEIYNEKGLNGIHAYLKRNGIEYKQEKIEFGLHTNKSTQTEKTNWINHLELKFHLYSLGIKSKGFSYNRIRGTQFIIL